MEDRRITKDEQMCIAECIRTYWGENSLGENSENRDLDIRDEQYETCLTDCKICG